MPSLASTLNGTHRKRKISLTPLIDVVFILLVFFMLASSFEKNRSIELIPPPEGRSAPIPNATPPVLIEVLGKGVYMIDKRKEQLSFVKNRLLANLETTFLIKPSANATLQDLVLFLDIAAAIPDLKFSLLAVDPPGRK